MKEPSDQVLVEVGDDERMKVVVRHDSFQFEKKGFWAKWVVFA